MMEIFVPRLKSGPRITWMNEETLEDECPTLEGVQGMIYGKVRVKHNPTSKCPTLEEAQSMTSVKERS
jgi:hypothetical protein